MGRLMESFFGGNPVIDLALVATVAFFATFLFVCYRMLRHGRSPRMQEAAALPLFDNETILRPGSSERAHSENQDSDRRSNQQ